MSTLEIIERVTRKIAPGPTPSFNVAHVLKVLELVDKHGKIGRIRLSKEIKLGEGITRTLLRHLKNEELIKSSRMGISLSEKGKSLFFELKNRISECKEIPRSPLTLGSYNIAILVRDTADVVKSGLEQRDIAIKSGATGATTLVFSGNKLSLPTDEENVPEKMPELHEKLVIQFNPTENDVIIVSCGENRELAELGARMAAFKLLKDKIR